MSKKRIHELAKEYSMSGKDLAAKLRDLGFSHIKSHMTALDDFEVLQVQAVLEAHGIIQESRPDEPSESAGGGLILRKKKKKKKLEAAAPTATEEDEEPEEPSASASEPEPVVAAEQDASGLVEEVEAEPADERGAAEGPPAAAESVESAAAELEAATETETEAEEDAPAAAGRAEPEAVAETPAATAAPVAEEPREEAAAKAPAEAAAEEREEDAATTAEEAPAPAKEKKKPEPPRRQGKVVGFIDLSKIQSAQPRRSESRRLRSRDDDMPDVQPTLRHDPRRAMMRGDRGSRDSLSAAQLREREAGRYLRRSRGPGARGGRDSGPRGRRDAPSGSPYSGGEVSVEMPLTVKKLAGALAIKPNMLLNIAFRQLGFGAVNINSVLDEDTAVLLANEFDVTLSVTRVIEAEEALITNLQKTREEVDEGQLSSRNPTVAFLGHVDHGKTTLIDKIRESQVAEGEDGGITQHIGAYQVTTDKGHTLTVVDTPGHAAFTAMRARGAKAVDVVVLVVAADAGPQPQTEEALAHARAAKSPIIVALTKCDKPEANPQRTKDRLASLDLIPEDYGGEIAMIEVSGITGMGVQDLLERVFLESEILELACHPSGPASGVVLEAEVQQGKGIVAHLLVQDGTLNRGDVILAGEGYGKVRSITDDRGRTIDLAGPAMPVEVSGLSALPGIGEPFHVVDKLDKAKEVAEERSRKNRAATLAEQRSMEGGMSLLQKVTGPTKETVEIIIRADVQGSAEVLKQSILDLAHEEVECRVLQSGVGAVTENDILLASTSGALVVAFRVGVNAQARQAAERENVEIRNYQVLYAVLDDVRDRMEGRLAPDIEEEVTGHAEIRRVFKSSRFGNIAGCFVLDGTIARDHRIRLLRDDTVVHTGTLSSIRREKDEVREIREGFECGMLVRNYGDIREGDVIEAFKLVEIKRTLSDTSSR